MSTSATKMMTEKQTKEVSIALALNLMPLVAMLMPSLPDFLAPPLSLMGFGYLYIKQYKRFLFVLGVQLFGPALAQFITGYASSWMLIPMWIATLWDVYSETKKYNQKVTERLLSPAPFILADEEDED